MVSLCLVGCGGARATILPKGMETINQANAQNNAIANNIAFDKPIQAAGIKNNTATIAKVIEVGANEEAMSLLNQLKADFEGQVARLTVEWEDEKQAYQTQIARNQKNAEDTQKELESTKWWLKLVGILGGVAVAARVAIGMGIPLGNIGTRIASFASGLGNIPQRIKNLTTLATGAEAGVKELETTERQLDVVLGGKISQEVSKLTGGKYKSLAELWKATAKAVAVDAGNHSGVVAELQKLRDEMPTNELESLKV